MVSVVSPSAGGVRPSQLQSIPGGHALTDQARCRHPQRPTCPPHLVRFGIDLGNDCAGMPATTSMLAHQRLADVQASLFAESRHLGNRYSLTLRVVSFDAPASQHLSACLLPTAKKCWWCSQVHWPQEAERAGQQAGARNSSRSPWKISASGRLHAKRLGTGLTCRAACVPLPPLVATTSLALTTSAVLPDARMVPAPDMPR